MSLALLAARVALAGVFAVAGLTKLRDLEGSRRAVADFGVPRRLVWLTGTLLPLVELATAALLLPHDTARWGAAAAVLLLLAFSGAIAFNLLRGRAPECRCFGQVHSTPVSWRMVARNLALATDAGAVTAGEELLAIGATAALGVVLAARRAPSVRRAAVGTTAPWFATRAPSPTHARMAARARQTTATTAAAAAWNAYRDGRAQAASAAAAT